MSYCPITGEQQCKCLYKNDAIHALKVDLKSTMRKLFTDHAVYTSFVLKLIVDKINDNGVYLTRLIENQKDIGNQLKPIIGDKHGNMLTALLTEHIKCAGDVMKAAVLKSNQLSNNIEKLFLNSEQVAKFLTSLNPVKLPLNETKMMFDTHNQFVIDMTTSRIKKDYKREQQLYDAYYNEILAMSDMIYNAL
ncbi:MAG TPA: hypothetical protein VLG50_02170 [Candidatus Saccharimonadales bacterium]|nr:hypothetical protein [Candidatus Saccharimonadales bacterium]